MHLDSRLSDIEQAVDLERDTGYYVMLAARAFARVAEQRLRGLGLGVAHLAVLVALDREGSLTQKELARRIRVRQPTAAALLQRMDAAGLLERTPDLTDRRSVRIKLSRRASQVLPRALGLRTDAIAAAVAGLSTAEVDTLNEMLRRVLRNLDAILTDHDDHAQ